MVHLDLRNIEAARLGPERGFDLDAEQRAFAARFDAFVEALHERAADPAAMLGWIALADGEGAELDAIEAYAAEARARFTDAVVLGIGGSSLGARTVATALQHPQRVLQGANGDGLRLHFVDNVDPDEIRGLQEVLDPTTTLIDVISKSGTTAETMAGYLSFDTWLRDAVGDHADAHTVVTTDPEGGILRPLAERAGLRAFGVPASVGGRFSVFSPVGLLPLALGGVDVRGLLRGAAWANEDAGLPMERSVVRRATLVQHLAWRRGAAASVLMPYASRLRALPAWFVQLWAESLGKAVDRHGSEVHAGSTPLAALGTTDQHSQVQLFNEGPADKIVAFVRVEAFDSDTAIPAPRSELQALDYLSEAPFARLMNAEQAATAHALAAHRRPNYTLGLPRLDAPHLGALLQLLMWQTALMGELWEIDAFDQPGVELGKVYTYALMGREGFEDTRRELSEAGVRIDAPDDDPGRGTS